MIFLRLEILQGPQWLGIRGTWTWRRLTLTVGFLLVVSQTAQWKRLIFLLNMKLQNVLNLFS